MGDAERLVATVAECLRRGSTLTVVGHGSKARFGSPAGEMVLSTRDHAGIVDYRPEELVVTALAGTPVGELAETVAERGQMLPFDPPRYGGEGTLGGAIASGISGPARPWRGSVRDAVLGVEIVNGRGERLRFGGSVMKNVAGYDVSRLMTGAWGTLGVILSASIRLLPVPPVEETLRTAWDAARAAAELRRWAHRPLPITGTCQVGGEFSVRLSGSASAVASAQAAMGVDEPGDPELWAAVRDHRHGFFEGDGALTRLSLSRGAQFDNGDALIEWGGSQVWLPGVPDTLPAGAFATVFEPGEHPRRLPEVDPAIAKYEARIKQAFDPEGIFNPGLAA